VVVVVGVVVVVVVGVVVVVVGVVVVGVVVVGRAVVGVVGCAVVVEVGDTPAAVDCGAGDVTERVALEPESESAIGPELVIGIVSVVAAPVLVVIPLAERGVAPLGGGAAAGVVALLGVVDPPGRAAVVGTGIRAVVVSASSPTRLPTATADPVMSRTRAMPPPTTVTTRRESGVSS
jgi:hypothetical protein